MTEKRGGVHYIIEHQAVGYALADAKTSMEAARYLSWRACHALDTQSPGADELAIQAKIYDSETAVRRRQLHTMLMQPTYDALTACGGA